MVSLTKSRSGSLKNFDWTQRPSTSDFQKRVKDTDWTKSPLGSISQWPASLRQLVLLSTADPSPSAVVYGSCVETAAIVFNEAFSKVLGVRIASFLQGRLVRGQLLDQCANFDSVLERQFTNGCAELVKSQCIRTDRLGFVQEKVYTWKFVPIVGSDGEISGSLVTVEDENKTPPRRERSRSAVREIGDAVKSAIGMPQCITVEKQSVADSQVDRTATQAAVNIRRLDEHFSGRSCNCEELWQIAKANDLKEQRDRRFADHAPVGITALKSSYEVQWGNTAFHDITTMPRESAESRCLFDYIHREDVAEVRKCFEPLLEGESFTLECRLKKWAPSLDSPVSERELELSPSWIMISGYKQDEERTMAWVIDITSHKQAEEVSRRRMDEAIEDRQQKERFIDTISHEIRNPLSAIVHCTDEVIDEVRNNHDSSSPTVLEAAETIAYCTQHIRNIVGDVLTLSKLDSRLVEICPVPTRPVDLVQDALKIFTSELRSGGIELDIQQERSLQELDIEWLMFDPSRTLQVLINIVTNAIKVVKGREKRRISIRLGVGTSAPWECSKAIQCVQPLQAPRPVDFGESLNQEQPIYLTIDVEDTGPGFDSEEMDQLFQRLTQANPKTESKYGGSGLGLFISRDLTELHGGRIGVASVPGSGSTFTFSIETRRTTAPKTPPRVPSLEIPTRLRGSSTSDSPVVTAPSLRPSVVVHQTNGKPDASKGVPTVEAQQQSPRAVQRILVVEDNLINQKVLANQLRKKGYEVDVALHGGEALERLNMVESPAQEPVIEAKAFDCVLMDLEMPVMDGLTCVSRIRQWESERAAKAVPVIAVTANARHEHEVAVIDAGMQSICTKPYKVDNLISQMERVCSAAG